MAENKAKKILSGQVRVPEELDRDIDMEASRRGWFKYEVVQAAFDALQAAEKRGAAVPESEQTITCPHCESTLSVGSDNVTKVVVPGKPLAAEQTTPITPERAPMAVEAQSWLDLACRAVTVQDPDWCRMLRNLKNQLEQVATIADSEHGNRGDLQEPGGGDRVTGSGKSGGKPRGAVHARRKKAG